MKMPRASDYAQRSVTPRQFAAMARRIRLCPRFSLMPTPSVPGPPRRQRDVYKES